MGKAQRSKNRRADEQLANPTAFVEKENSGKGLKIALAIIALVVAASLVFAFIQSSGAILRADYGYKSENFEIDGAMMQYLYHSQIYTFVENYYYYIYYYSLMGYEIVDFTRPLQDQKFSSTAQSLFGTYEGTWFDFFWEKADAQAKQIIVLCEAAKADGVYNDYKAEAADTVKTNMDSYKEVAKESFPSLSAYFEYLFGKGVKKSDVESIETLQTIASAYYTDKYTELEDKISADKEGIDKYYEDNKSNYLMADYVVASFTASLGTNATDAEKAEFLQEIEELKKHADNVSKLNDVAAINTYLVDYWFEESYDEAFKDAFKTDKVAEEEIPTEGYYNDIKSRIKTEVFAKAFDENYDETATSTFFTAEEGELIYKTLNTLVTSLIKTAKTGIDEVNVKGEAFAESTDKDKWMFSTDRQAGDVAIFYGTEESEEDGFDEDKDKTYVVNVFYITEPVHRDENPTVEFGHILLTTEGEFTTETAQKEKLIALKETFEKGEKTKDAFEAIAKDLTEDTEVFYNNVCPEEMVEEINDWIFSTDRKAGDLNIIKTTYGTHLVYFVDVCEEQVWFVEAKNDYLTDSFDAWYTELEKSYEGAIEKNADIATKMSSANALLNYAA